MEGEVPVDLLARLLGRGYSIHKKIGKGGFAAVYQGTYEASEEVVAIKIITIRFAKSFDIHACSKKLPLIFCHLSEVPVEDRHLLENEVEACKKLNHKNIVQVPIPFTRTLYDLDFDLCSIYLFQVKEIFREEHYITIVMEYFDGGDLLSYVNSVQISESNARFMFIQILDALRYAHTMGFVHLDVK